MSLSEKSPVKIIGSLVKSEDKQLHVLLFLLKIFPNPDSLAHSSFELCDTTPIKQNCWILACLKLTVKATEKHQPQQNLPLPLQTVQAALRAAITTPNNLGDSQDINQQLRSSAWPVSWPALFFFLCHQLFNFHFSEKAWSNSSAWAGVQHFWYKAQILYD